MTFDPADAEAKRQLERVRWICGERPPVASRDACSGRGEAALRELAELVEQAERLLVEGDRAGARERFRRVSAALRWFRYSLEGSDLPRRAQVGLERARR